MIRDAKIVISCDYCHDSIYYGMPWKYTDYDSNKNDIAEFLENEGWFTDGDKHFCCHECYEAHDQKEAGNAG